MISKHFLRGGRAVFVSRFNACVFSKAALTQASRELSTYGCINRNNCSRQRRLFWISSHSYQNKSHPISVVGLRLLSQKSPDSSAKQSSVVCRDATGDGQNTVAKTPSDNTTRWQRVKAELIHYYHGFRLFFIELKIAIRLLGKVFTGKQLSWRERRHFTRTAADIFRIVPFAVFIVVPFMEFLLPFYLKFFPGMLPSTFTHESKEEEKIRKQMRVKLRVAKFLQDMLEETAVNRSKVEQGDVAEDLRRFSKFMIDIRSGKRQPTNEEILKFTALLKDELTLENLDHLQLVCLCQLLGLSSVGPDYLLHLQIRLRMRLLLADDKILRHDGVESLVMKDLQKACRERGMCTTGVSKESLQNQLSQWLEFHLKHQIPVTLLVLSRSFYLPDVVSPEQMISQAIAQLPIDLERSASLKLAESKGIRVDNRKRVDELKREEDAIAKENIEIAEKDRSEVPSMPPAVEPSVPAASTDKRLISPSQVSEIEGHHGAVPMSDKDVLATRLASALLQIASQKHIDLSDLEYVELKDEIRDFKAGEEKEGKSVSLLTKKITKLLDGVSSLSEKLNKKRIQLEASIEDAKSHGTDMNPQDEQTSDAAMKKDFTNKRQDLIQVSEMLGILDKLKVGGASDLDESAIVQIIKQLDLDGDNHIAIADILQVLEYIYSDRSELSRSKLQEIAELVAKERLTET